MHLTHVNIWNTQLSFLFHFLPESVEFDHQIGVSSILIFQGSRYRNFCYNKTELKTVCFGVWITEDMSAMSSDIVFVMCVT